MGRFHRHDDGTAHEHDHPHDGHEHPHDGHEHDRAPEDRAPEDRAPEDRGRGDREPRAASSGHGDLSGYRTGPERVLVLERIFDENDRCAQLNRDLLDAAGVVGINMMSSPGAGKTSLLQHTLAGLKDPSRVGIVEGDIETSIDADRLAGYGSQIALLNTSAGFGGECHLDAPMVGSALGRLDLTTIDLLFIENVGNLVCPAEFDVGAHHRVMVFAITEGEEKPLKYPVMFRSVDLVLVNKLDLLPHLDFDMDLFERNLRTINPAATLIRVSARSGEGLDAWQAWLDEHRAPMRAGDDLAGAPRTMGA